MKKPLTCFLPGLVVFSLATLPGCASEVSVNTTDTAGGLVQELPDEPPGIRGMITRADSAAGSSFILVEENPGDAAGSQKASVRLNDQTKIYRRSGSILEKTGQQELTAGKTVSVWFTGPVAESYPVQGTASVILLED